jgi:hypothetical protein
MLSQMYTKWAAFSRGKRAKFARRSRRRFHVKLAGMSLENRLALSGFGVLAVVPLAPVTEPVAIEAFVATESIHAGPVEITIAANASVAFDPAPIEEPHANIAADLAIALYVREPQSLAPTLGDAVAAFLDVPATINSSALLVLDTRSLDAVSFGGDSLISSVVAVNSSVAVNLSVEKIADVQGNGTVSLGSNSDSSPSRNQDTGSQSDRNSLVTRVSTKSKVSFGNDTSITVGVAPITIGASTSVSENATVTPIKTHTVTATVQTSTTIVEPDDSGNQAVVTIKGSIGKSSNEVTVSHETSVTGDNGPVSGDAPVSGNSPPSNVGLVFNRDERSPVNIVTSSASASTAEGRVPIGFDIAANPAQRQQEHTTRADGDAAPALSANRRSDLPDAGDASAQDNVTNRGHRRSAADDSETTQFETTSGAPVETNSADAVDASFVPYSHDVLPRFFAADVQWISAGFELAADFAADQWSLLEEAWQQLLDALSLFVSDSDNLLERISLLLWLAAAAAASAATYDMIRQNLRQARKRAEMGHDAGAHVLLLDLLMPGPGEVP